MALIQSFHPGRSGHILLTTRSTAVGSKASALLLKEMTTEESLAFLLSRSDRMRFYTSLNSVDPEVRHWGEAIAKVIGGLPLALDQAGAWIDETGSSFEEYYRLFQDQKLYFLQRRGQSADTHPAHVFMTWLPSLNTVQQLNPQAIELLSFSTFLDPDLIPMNIFIAKDEKSGIMSTAIVPNELMFYEAIEILLTYSLVQRNPQRTLTIHRLMQTVFKERMDWQTQQRWASQVISRMNDIFPKVTYQTWEDCQSYLPHVFACAAHMQTYHIASLEATSLLYKAGLYLFYRARYGESQAIYEVALTVAEKVIETREVLMAAILNALANVYYVQNNHEKAKLLFIQALAIREEVVGAEHLDTAESLCDLARFYYVHARYPEAEAYYLRAIAIRQNVLGRNAELTAESLQRLAVLYHAQRRYTDAEPLYKQVLVIQKHLLGLEHPDTLDTLDCLAQLQYIQGDYEGLEQQYQYILSTRKRVLGSQHHHTAISMNSLALFYREQQRYELAEALHQEALKIQKEALGSEHPNVAVSLGYLAAVYHCQERYLDAERFYLEAFALREKAKGLEHPYTMKSFQTLISFYCDQHQYLQAKLLYQQRLQLREEKLGMQHAHVALFQENYKAFLEKLPGSV